MTKYGQFCPIAKSSELLGDTWTILIIRELLLGSTRFSQLQKGMPKISPTILTKRLKELEANGVVMKRKQTGQKGHQYRLTPAGRELSTVIEALAVWGMRWARDEMQPDDLDATFLMFDIERNIATQELPDGENVICFQFPDLQEFSKWWVVCDGQETDLCYQNPGKDVNAYVTANSLDLINVWMGDLSLSTALKEGRVTLLGETPICNRFRKWFPLSSAAKVPRPSDEERLAM